MKIVIGITSVLLLAVFSVAYLYFSNLTGHSRSNDKTLAAIPAGTSVIFNFSNDGSLYEIFKDYTLFNGIIGDNRKRELSWLKSLLFDNPDLYSATRGQKVYLSFHQLPSNSLQFLWVMPLAEDLAINELAELIGKRNNDQTEISSIGEISLLEIRNNSMNDIFYIGVKAGIARGSFSRGLVLESLDKNGKKIGEEYADEINRELIKEGDALASLYLNHGEPGFLNTFFQKPPTGNFGLFSSSDTYSNLHINYKSDALMFNGVTRIAENRSDYLNLFLLQKPVRNTIKRILPDNLSNAICFGVSDYSQFNKDLKNLFEIRKELSGLDELLLRITTETGINPDRDIKKLWGNEFSNVQLSTLENMAIISITNGRQLQFFLEPLSTYYTGDVRRMNYDKFFYYYFGDPVKAYTKPYFAVTDNLVIISNSPGTVQRFLNDYNSDRFLNSTDSFTQFDQLVADHSNISFLLHFKNSERLLKSLLKKDYSSMFGSKEYQLKDFYGISYQLTSNADHFFANFYVGYENNVAHSVDSLVYSQNTKPY